MKLEAFWLLSCGFLQIGNGFCNNKKHRSSNINDNNNNNNIKPNKNDLMFVIVSDLLSESGPLNNNHDP